MGAPRWSSVKGDAGWSAGCWPRSSSRAVAGAVRNPGLLAFGAGSRVPGSALSWQDPGGSRTMRRVHAPRGRPMKNRVCWPRCSSVSLATAPDPASVDDAGAPRRRSSSGATACGSSRTGTRSRPSSRTSGPWATEPDLTKAELRGDIDGMSGGTVTSCASSACERSTPAGRAKPDRGGRRRGMIKRTTTARTSAGPASRSRTTSRDVDG